MKKRGLLVALLVLVTSMSMSAQASISWTDLTSVDGKTVYGSLVVDSQTVGVSVTNTASYAFVQTSGGTNWWDGSAYTIGSVNCAPPTSDLIALSTGGSVTVTFSQAVTNPILGLVSWNGNTVEFGTDISFLSYGQGHFGNGTPVINAGGTGFYGSGEVHGLLQVEGTFTSFTFTNTSEYWHGFTIGAEGLPPSPSVPVPAAAWLLGSGLLSLVGLRRRIRE